MDLFETLEKKIREAAHQLAVLRQENRRLKGEIEFLQAENSKVKILLQENNAWREQKKIITARIEKLMRRLNSLKA